ILKVVETQKASYSIQSQKAALRTVANLICCEIFFKQSYVRAMIPTTTSNKTGHRATEARRVALASAVGTRIEWYDFFIYGTAAAVVFAPQFFPQVSALAGRLAAFATFAIGFVARPL